MEAAVGAIERELRPVELFVSNAGILIAEPLEQTAPDAWQRLIDVNLTGAYLCARRILPGMRAAHSAKLRSATDWIVSCSPTAQCFAR